MAGKSAVLSVRIIADATKAAAGFNDAEKQVEGFTGKLDRIGGTVDKAAGYATAAAGAYIGLAKTFTDSASEMEQSTGAVEAVFKGQADQIKQLAAEASKSVGLAASDYQNMASVMGSQLMNMGIAQEEVVGTTSDLITLGGDLASMFGGTTADAVDALSSLLRGERDPIERYAVSMNQAAVNAKMAEMGLSGLEGEAAKQAETQATLALLFEQTADAQGNFARETDTAAGSAQIAAAEWENAKAKLGEQFLPIAVQAAEWLGKIAQAAGENPELFMQIGIAVGVAAGALMGISGTIKIIQSASAAFKIFNMVIAANPVGLAVTAIAALAAGLIYAYQNSETFRNGVDTMGRFVKQQLEWVGETVLAVGQFFTNPIESVQNFARIAGERLDMVQNILGTVRDWLTRVGNSGTGMGNKIASAIAGVIGWLEKMIGWVRSAWEWVEGLFSSWNKTNNEANSYRGGSITAAGSDPDMTMQLANTEILKFSSTLPDMTMQAAAPDVTAQRVNTLAGINSARGTTIINYEINVSGSLDGDEAAEKIIKLIKKHDDRQVF